MLSSYVSNVLLLILLFILHKNSGSKYVEVDESGGSHSLSQKEFPVEIYNSLTDRSISLFWLGITGRSIGLGEISPGSSTEVNVKEGRKLFATDGGRDGKLLNPEMIVITKEQKKYSFDNSKTSIKSTKTKTKPNSIPETKTRPPIQPSTHSPNHTFTAQRRVSKIMMEHSFAASAKFRNFVPDPVDIWYDDGADGVFQGRLGFGKEFTINAYEGHVFFFTDAKDKSKEYISHTVRSNQVLYVIEDFDRPIPPHLLSQHLKEERYMEEYYEKTGIQWRHYFGPNGPRGPPVHHMWSGERVGQKHVVNSTEGYWYCRGSTDDCQSNDIIPFSLELISVKPRVFIVEHFLTTFECDAIIASAAPKMSQSIVGLRDAGGARTSDTRTSRNTWLSRGANEITESLYRRAEHLLKIERLDNRNSEDIQVVHYTSGQKYDSHHDWSVQGYPESRFATLLLYLNDMESPSAGGETAFPKGASGRGLKVHPGKGNAVLFYDLLEDGNGDDLSLHAALPVTQGEKWLANFWVWDPKRPGK